VLKERLKATRGVLSNPFIFHFLLLVLVVIVVIRYF
jgi:hypothetical protein